jgi:diguanylate cyclase
LNVAQGSSADHARAEAGAALPRAGGGERLGAMRTQSMVAAFYLLDALFIAGFAALQVVPMAAAWSFGLAGCGLTALFVLGLKRGLHRRIGAARFTSLQLLSACGLMLGTAASVPQIGMLLLLTMLVALATAAVQMPRRQVLSVTLLIGLCALLLLLLHGPAFGLPLARPWERLLSGLWFSVVLAKIAVINLIGSALREALLGSRERLSAALEQVRELSEQDDLTGLANRRSVMAQLEGLLARFAGGGAPFAVAILDVDHFKRVNDQHGHAMGDEVLRHFAQAAAGSLRSSDRVARFGGEEFLLVLPGMGEPAAAEASAERVRQSVQQHVWTAFAEGLQVTCSIGVSVSRPGDTLAALLQRADAALYRAKAEGRNTVRLE